MKVEVSFSNSAIFSFCFLNLSMVSWSDSNASKRREEWHLDNTLDT